MIYKCPQDCPDLIRLITSRPTPYFLVKSLVRSFENFISLACISVSFAFGWFSPIWRGGLLSRLRPITLRPFAIISSKLLFIVPKLKWPGLQQAGLSHECIITIPHGISPFSNSKTNLWANFFGPLFGLRIMPYPLLFLFANQGQHSPSERFSIFAQSLFSKVSRFPAINKLWATGGLMSTIYRGAPW